MRYASELYDKLLSNLASLMREHGYKKSRASFKKLSTDGIAIIDFQKSLNSNKDTILFTANVGIAYRALIDEEGGLELGKFGTQRDSCSPKNWDVC